MNINSNNSSLTDPVNIRLSINIIKLNHVIRYFCDKTLHKSIILSYLIVPRDNLQVTLHSLKLQTENGKNNI